MTARLQALTLLVLGSVTLVALFWTTAAAAVQIWFESRTFNHGFFILPVCLYLAWLRRADIGQFGPRPDLRGVIAAAFAAFGWLLGHAADVLVVQQLALVAMFQALCFAVLGWRAVRQAAFPLFYLYFAVPIGEFLVAPLQDLTAWFTVAALRLTGVPVFLDGVFISIPTGRFAVAEACAGVRFLISTVALGVLGANLFFRTWPRRLAFVGISIVVPIIANGLRAYGIVLIAYLTDHRIAVGVDHIVYGWLFFAFVTALLVALGATFRDKRSAIGNGLRTVAANAASGPASPPRRLVLAALATILVAAAAPIWGTYAEGRMPAVHALKIEAPRVRQPWRPLAGRKTAWQPLFIGADATYSGSYGSGGRSVDLYIAYYARQRQGAEIVNRLNRLADGRAWKRAGSDRTEARVEGRLLTVVRTRLLSHRGDRIVWHWYWVNGRYTANPYFAKLLQAGAELMGGTRAAAVIAVAADNVGMPSTAEMALRAFLDSLCPLAPVLQRAARQEERHKAPEQRGSGEACGARG